MDNHPSTLQPPEIKAWYEKRPCATCEAGKLLVWEKPEFSLGDPPRHSVAVGNHLVGIYCWLMKTRLEWPDMLLSCEAHSNSKRDSK